MPLSTDARQKLYDFADAENVRVVSFPLPECRSVAMPMVSGAVVGIDCSAPMTSAEETVCLAHELGHCATGSFYSRKTPFETRERCERTCGASAGSCRRRRCAVFCARGATRTRSPRYSA